MNAIDEAKAAAAAGDGPKAAALLRGALAGPLDYLEQVRAARLVDKLEADPRVAQNLTPVRLAVLGSTTTAQLLPLLRLHGFKEGLRVELYNAPFGAYQQEILDPASGLYAFKPQAALLFVNYRDARPGTAEDEAARWERLWKTLRERASCAVIMNNFDSPVERPLGNLEATRTDAGLGRLRRLNELMAKSAGGGVAILDQEHLSGVMGKERWHDARFWHSSRQAMSFEALARYAAEAAAVLKAVMGRSRKCLVVDLDGTLWGGLVGEDGAEGLEIADTPRGEAFVEFQRYLKALKERGVLLAVCSKNDDTRAREPFLKRPEMALKLEDFAAFVANWDDKAKNLKSIAKTLNLGLDALAFVDDTAGEREIVRRFCPDIAVVDLPEDPADFTRCLDSLRLFETVGVSREDSSRTAHFQAEAQRSKLQEGAADLDSFLKDLEMTATVASFQEADVERITQLINKTNQFNLTTRRRAEPEVRDLMKDPNAVCVSVRLADRLSDYGLISAAIGKKAADTLEIDTWLMSCRVLGRGVERLVFNRLLEAARAWGATSIVGDYLPTAKNALVKDLLADFGFKRSEDDRWRLAVAKAKASASFIQVS